jgi:hypothetical protein
MASGRWHPAVEIWSRCGHVGMAVKGPKRTQRAFNRTHSGCKNGDGIGILPVFGAENFFFRAPDEALKLFYWPTMPQKRSEAARINFLNLATATNVDTGRWPPFNWSNKPASFPMPNRSFWVLLGPVGPSLSKRTPLRPPAAARQASQNHGKLATRGVHLVAPGCNNIVPGGTGGRQFVLTFVADAGSAWG